MQNVATLNYDLLKGQGLNATLDLLSQYSRIKLLQEKILTIRPTEAPLPRSIRIKIELTSSLEETREKPEFKTLQGEAENAKLYYQQKMRQLITKTFDLDKSTLKKRLRESFFDHVAMLIETKNLYELQMAPKESNVSKVFESNGGSKTAAAYTCLKIFEEEQITTSSLYTNFLKLQTYLDTTSDEIKKGILSRFKKDEAEKLLSHRTVLDNDLMRLYQYDIKNIITYCANDMTTEIVKQHNEEIKKRNAIATTAATFNSKKTEETTAAVATALSKEGSMSTKSMEDYINKRIKESLAKNAKNDKSGRDNQLPVNASKRGQNNPKTLSKKRKYDNQKEDNGAKGNKNK